MIVDLFAGPGGWDEGLSMLGRDDVVGIELDKDAVACREAAGHGTIVADVTALDPYDFAGAEGLIASPPCQSFSIAGKGAGLDDDRGPLVFEIIRWAKAIRPYWIACEEVKEVLPIWKMFTSELRHMGYKAWAGLLNAADYGVPQVRKRAFLMASRSPFSLPTQTHGKQADFDLFQSGLKPWVTAAQALNLPDACKTRENQWAWDRPATTVVRSFRPEVIAAPKWRGPGDGPRQNAPGSLVVTEQELKLLQGIRHDYPITAKAATKRLSLIGAFLPPAWAAAVLSPLIASVARPMICQNCGNDEALPDLTLCQECLA